MGVGLYFAIYMTCKKRGAVGSLRQNVNLFLVKKWHHRTDENDEWVVVRSEV